MRTGGEEHAKVGCGFGKQVELGSQDIPLCKDQIDVYVCVCVCVCLPVCLFVCLSACLSACLLLWVPNGNHMETCNLWACLFQTSTQIS